MTMTSTLKLKALTILVLVGSSLILYAPGLTRASRSAPETSGRLNSGVNTILNIRGRARVKSERTLQLSAGKTYSLLLSASSLRGFGPEGRLQLRLRSGMRDLAAKTLHGGDADISVLFRPPATGPVTILLEPYGLSDLPYRLKVLEWKSSESDVAVESEPNNSWQEANVITTGYTVFASADDRSYLPPPGGNSTAVASIGEDWFRFEFDGGAPKLLFFTLELEDRDNIPVDVAVFRIRNGAPVAFEDGMDPVTPPHEVQALAGNKFTTRVLTEKGTYYLRVTANHPSYQLRTAVYPVPPYGDPRQAVRTSLDYLLNAGDSWHANTPRKGGIYDRISNVHAETSTCVACHATHFTLRPQLYAVQRGYPVKQKPQLQFLTERFYNNPRPFYGHPAASWARVISAPANVLSRMGALLNIFEHEVSGDYRDSFFKGIGEYLKLYYKSRTQLPPDESNGNTPIVSTYEVAWYSWTVLDELYRRSGDREYSATRDRVAGLIEQGPPHKNMLDLCYQTLAFCSIDRKRYAERIRQNCERILSLQRPSGQWPMTLDAGAPEAEFQTGHCLWTLGVAGYPRDDARIAKSLQYLLGRQQQFGAWFDPAQAYENFRTPFRESQMAALAFSTYYPEGQNGRSRSMLPEPATGPPHRSTGSHWMESDEQPLQLQFNSISGLLDSLDRIWDPPSAKLAAQIRTAVFHQEPLVRQAALLCLGRIGGVESVQPIRLALGDESKIVQRAAAWSMRQLYNRRGAGSAAVAEALLSPDDRTRWGATRVFATHFSAFTQERRLLDKLLSACLDVVPSIRIQALKGLWQWWYWTARETDRNLIEDSFLSQLASPQHAWVRSNLLEGLYNIADENIRYLYNNWIPLLGTRVDGEQAIQARLLIERRLAGKIARALQSGSPALQEALLRTLSEFHLRDAASYDSRREGNRTYGRAASSYVRIGNDIETIQFFGDAAEVLARALFPYLESNDPLRRQLALKAAFTLREVRLPRTYASSGNLDFRDVLRLAGYQDEARQRLARAVYARLLDTDNAVRMLARETYRVFTPNPQSSQGEWNALLRDLLTSSQPEARNAALEAISTAGKIHETSQASAQSAREGDSDLGPMVAAIVLSADVNSAGPALAALQSIPTLQRDPKILERIDQVLASEDARLVRAALTTVLKSPQMQESPLIRRRLDRIFSAAQSRERKTILDLVTAETALLADARVRSLIAEALLDKDNAVIVSALGLVRQDKSLQGRPEISAALADLRSRSGLSPAVSAGLEVLSRGDQSGSSAPKFDASARPLDYRFFADRIQKIFTTPGRDHNACADCHKTHAILRLNPPGPDDVNSEEELRQNYRSALKVVNLLDPEASLLLRKPTSNSETEGTVGSAQLSHGGGIRWTRDSDEYRTILQWIQGGALAAAHK